jgi:hypothetical protein
MVTAAAAAAAAFDAAVGMGKRVTRHCLIASHSSVVNVTQNNEYSYQCISSIVVDSSTLYKHQSSQ